MTLRFYSRRINGGYGVSTFETEQTNADIEYSILSILLRDLPGNIRLQTRGDDPEDYVKLAITCTWKLSLRIGVFNNSELQMFNARTGKAKYGTYVCGLQDYFVDEKFVNYQNVQSKLYNCTYVLNLPDFELDGPPCNEPPADLTVPPIAFADVFYSVDAYRIPLTNRNSSTNSNTDLTGADSIFVYFEKAVRNWISGITYAFNITGFTSDDVLEGTPLYVLF